MTRYSLIFFLKYTLTTILDTKNQNHFYSNLSNWYACLITNVYIKANQTHLSMYKTGVALMLNVSDFLKIYLHCSRIHTSHTYKTHKIYIKHKCYLLRDYTFIKWVINQYKSYNVQWVIFNSHRLLGVRLSFCLSSNRQTVNFVYFKQTWHKAF